MARLPRSSVRYDLSLLSHRFPASAVACLHDGSRAGATPGSAQSIRRQRTALRAQLACPMSAALVQMVELIGRTLGADVAGGRIYDGADQVADVHVSDARGASADEAARAALHDWPHAARSIFDLLRWYDSPRATRSLLPLHDLARTLAPTWSHEELYAGVLPHTPVHDAMGVLLPLNGAARAAVIYLRCRPGAPFTIEQQETLDQLRPAMAAALRRGQQALQESDTAQAWTPSHEARSRDTIVSLLQRLSRTERRVLRLLRRGHTERGVAEQLDRSPHTVHVHVKNIYRKLTVTSRTELFALFQHRAPARGGGATHG